MSDWLGELILCFAFFLIVFISPWILLEVWKLSSSGITKLWHYLRRICCRRRVMEEESLAPAQAVNNTQVASATRWFDENQQRGVWIHCNEYHGEQLEGPAPMPVPLTQS